MKIWLVSIFEQTPVDKVFSTRFLSIAQEALSRGHEVTFWGSTFKHNTKKQRFEKTTYLDYTENYKLIFVKSIGYEKNVAPKRLFSHALLGKEMVKEMNVADKPDVILLAFPPISLAFHVTAWAKQNDVPIIMDIIDPWPTLFESAVPRWASFLNDSIFKLPKTRLTESLKKVDFLTAISNQYLDWSSEFFEVPKKECLYPAADYSAIRGYIDNAKALDLPDKKLNLIYAGSLASSYDIETILAAAKQLSDYEDIHFYVAGAGPKEIIIQEYLANHSNLTFLGRLDKDVLMDYYAHCQLGMTQHIKGATQSVTYKLFDLLSAGLPILNSLESEMKDIIVDNEVGLHNMPGDSEGLAQNILTIYRNPDKLKRFQENGLQLASEIGDTKVIYERFVDLIELQWE